MGKLSTVEAGGREGREGAGACLVARTQEILGLIEAMDNTSGGKDYQLEARNRESFLI